MGVNRTPSELPAARAGGCYPPGALESKVSDLTDAAMHLKIVGESRVVAPASRGI
jgi:hypothetical protein